MFNNGSFFFVVNNFVSKATVVVLTRTISRNDSVNELCRD